MGKKYWVIPNPQGDPNLAHVLDPLQPWPVDLTKRHITAPTVFDCLVVPDLEWLPFYPVERLFQDKDIAKEVGATQLVGRNGETAEQLIKLYYIKPFSCVELGPNGIARVDGVDVTDQEGMLRRRVRLDYMGPHVKRQYPTRQLPLDHTGDPGLRFFYALARIGYGHKLLVQAPMEGGKSSYIRASLKSAALLQKKAPKLFITSAVIAERSEDDGEVKQIAAMVAEHGDVSRFVHLGSPLATGFDAAIRVFMVSVMIGLRMAESGYDVVALYDSLSRFGQSMSEQIDGTAEVAGFDKGALLSGGFRTKVLPPMRRLLDSMGGNFASMGLGTVTPIMTMIIPRKGDMNDGKSLEMQVSAQLGRGTTTATHEIVTHTGPYSNVFPKVSWASLAREDYRLLTLKQLAEREKILEIKSTSLTKRRKGEEEEGGAMAAVAEVLNEYMPNHSVAPDMEYLRDGTINFEDVPGELEQRKAKGLYPFQRVG